MVHHLVATAHNETDILCHHHTVHKPVNNTVAATIIEEINHIHYQLSQIHDLKPSEHVNALFTKLVTLSTYQYDDQTLSIVLNHPIIKVLIPTLRTMASQGEYFLELTWATNLIEQTREYQEGKPNLSRFVYYQNYQDLVQLELNALRGVGAQFNNIVFIGSGPLPLTPILMYQQLPSAIMHNIDRDQASITISNELLQKLGIAHGFRQHVMDAIAYPDFQGADVVMLGALVGQDVTEKLQFLKTIGKNMKSGSFLLARSAHSLRKLLYPSIEPYQINTCDFETVCVLHPYNDVVNSVVIAKKI
ncbi:Nicotianamine synthase [Pilaira anomala]|nr:Nicotianamine synthase [Pilaira anomala]